MLFEHYLYSLSYENSLSYTVLLADTPRVAAYLKAIDEVVVKNDSVIELGAGPGIFGRYASKLSSKTTLIDNSDVGVKLSGLLNEVLAPNQKIEVMQSLIQAVVLNKNDVVIHELIGGRVLDEGLRHAMEEFTFHNSWIKDKDVKIIPQNIELWLQLVRIESDASLHKWEDVSLPPTPLIDSKPLLWATSCDDYTACSQWAKVAEFDSKKVDSWPKRIKPIVDCNVDGANAVLWGFRACLSSETVLDTRLGLGEPTSWGGTVELFTNSGLNAGQYLFQVSLCGNCEGMSDTEPWILEWGGICDG